MKIFKNIIALFIILSFAVSCEKEIDNLDKLNDVTAPENVSVRFDITQDNSGLVTVIPNAEGVTEYMISFGDSADVEPTTYGVSEPITHTYTEGVYTVGVTAVGLTGLQTTIEQDLNVTFKAPENLDVSVEVDAANPLKINVTVSADLATVIDVYFGEDPGEEPVHADPAGETVSHTYASEGEYLVKAIAKSGGEATTEYEETVVITGASGAVTLPINFESFTTNYAFTDFGMAVATVIDNPDQSGINTSARVGEFLKTDGAETWAGSFLTLGSPIDFSINKLFKMKVWSPKANVVVRLKVENIDDDQIFYEVDATTTVTNQWEELEFDFSGIDISQEYQKIIFFFDFGNPGDDATYFFDDVKLVLANVPQTLPVENFEGELPAFTSFGNIPDIEVVANPDQSGLNTTANTAKMVKSAGSETWAGGYFEVDSPLDLVNFNKVTVKTWSPKSGIIIKLKLENEDASITHEVDIVNATADAWEELVYDFSDAPSADYIRIVIFFDFDNVGDDSIYYFDEIELANDGGGTPTTIVFEDFEGEPPAFTNFGNAILQTIANPDPSGINTSANVGEFTKPTGAETWAGGFFDEPSPLDLDSYSKISIKTWSPKLGAVVKLKLENSANGDEAYEVDMTTTTTDAWEELVYDFSMAPDFNYDRVVIFFDFDNPGDDTIYYFDDYTLTN